LVVKVNATIFSAPKSSATIGLGQSGANTPLIGDRRRRIMMTKVTAVLLGLSLWSGAALAMGAGGGGGGGAAAGAGVPDPYKYYPVCRRGRAGVDCQCRIAGAENANAVCRPGEYCDTRNGTCGAAALGRTRGQ
jgi:hypothetical protein